MAQYGELPSAELPFDEIYAAVQRGDLAAQELATRRVLPLVVVAIQRRFRGQAAIDPDDAVAVDRSLDSSRFRGITGYVPPPWVDQIREMREFG